MFIYGPPAHVQTYVQAVALSETINKYSEWLSCTPVEGTSPPNNAKTIGTDPDLRGRSLMHCPNPNHWEFMNVPRLTEGVDFDFSEMRYVLYMGLAACGMISVNPDITTIADFKGKTINVSDQPPPPGGATGDLAGWDQFSQLILSEVEAAGLDTDKDIDKEFLNFGDSHIALKDGLLDSALTGFTARDARKGEWSPAGYLIEVMDTVDTYYIDFNPDSLGKTVQETGLPYPPYVLPANTLTGQTAPWNLSVKHMSWNCFSEFPDDVVTEILNVIGAHYDELPDFDPQFADVRKENFGMMGPSVEYYHPVTLQYCKDNNLQIGAY